VKEGDIIVGILPIVLFLLGVAFLLLGYFWKNSPNKETALALKGLAYLKNEISLLQDKVFVLEEKLKKNIHHDLKEVISTEADLKKVGLKEVESKEVQLKKEEPKEVDLKKFERIEFEPMGFKHVDVKHVEDKLKEDKLKEDKLKEDKLKEVELQETDPMATEGKGKSKLYVFNAKDQRESSSRSEPQRNISPKYQEVLELAANGQPIQEIAQRLSLSQDAIRMVLRTQQGGETR